MSEEKVHKEPKVFFGFYIPQALANRFNEYLLKRYGTTDLYGIKSITMKMAIERFLKEELENDQ